MLKTLILSILIIWSANAAATRCLNQDTNSPECLGGNCSTKEVNIPPCRFTWPPLSWLLCANSDGEALSGLFCDNGCPSAGGGCESGTICQTEPLGEYLGLGNGLCVPDDTDPPPSTVTDPPIFIDPASQCNNDETWVPNPNDSGIPVGRCQKTDSLVNCCIQNGPLACRLEVKACQIGYACATTGFCYQVTETGTERNPPKRPDLRPPELIPGLRPPQQIPLQRNENAPQ